MTSQVNPLSRNTRHHNAFRSTRSASASPPITDRLSSDSHTMTWPRCHAQPHSNKSVAAPPRAGRAMHPPHTLSRHTHTYIYTRLRICMRRVDPFPLVHS